MAERLVLVSKSDSQNPNVQIVDGIHAVLINKDDGQTAAQDIASAVAQCQAGGHPVDANYFDTVTPIADLAAGVLKDNLDCMIFLPRSRQIVEG